MRCQDVRESLLRRLDATDGNATNETEETDETADTALEEHLKHCLECRAFEQHQHHVDALLDIPALPVASSQAHPGGKSSLPPSPPLMMSRPGRVSTSSIMLAVQQQSQISQQVAQIQHQQQYRVARMRTGGLAFVILAFLALGSVPLLLLVILFVETDTMVNILSFLRSSIDVLYVLALSLQTALIVVTHNNLLLSLLAFAVVLMMGMWIRLMRPKNGL